MMKKMNPLGLVLKTSLEYNQPVITRMDITIGAYMSYTIYKPGYVSLPKKLMENAKKVAMQPEIRLQHVRVLGMFLVMKLAMFILILQ